MVPLVKKSIHIYFLYSNNNHDRNLKQIKIKRVIILGYKNYQSVCFFFWKLFIESIPHILGIPRIGIISSIFPRAGLAGS